jgi:hypothetical protein
MTATFAPTTDRPRLFDDRPLRARRPAAPDRDRAQPAPDPFSPPADPARPSEQHTVRESPHAPHGDQPTGADTAHHGNTLDHLISTVWDDLTAHRTVTCPVCHGHMVPRYGSGALPVGGRCRRCGSSLG